MADEPEIPDEPENDPPPEPIAPLVLPPIPTTKVVTVPAVAELVYENLRVSDLQVVSRQPNDPYVAIAKFQRYAIVNGLPVVHPGDAVSPLVVRIDSLLLEAAQDEELAAVVSGLLGVMVRIGMQRGVL